MYFVVAPYIYTCQSFLLSKLEKNYDLPSVGYPIPLKKNILLLLIQGSGRPDWAIFCQLRYFWRVIKIFWKGEVAQNNVNVLGYFLFKQIYYIFT